ncbi:MAG: 4-hydroxythreonine-4-phosphate dehydrogenase PdxA [Candidatus Omnitrophica bacterium]|nr:4-hydroxythreonine-4-phosphate dehydrogenase PdxA [Candidatus Omnitrophota bacterium]MBU4473055.1 4-hydroxythreonine-4-phosphate dehydrogenase PdxA [Candidatus Omnitrophota bacterium]MCG2706654.1 4-hydroxythreonine-4-phosphate dehydrogenase PdxA [Candidatus Omnitrophota bacterium]
MGNQGYRIKVGITMGDPSGIGPGIIAKSIGRLKSQAEFIIIGDKWVFDKNLKFKIPACPAGRQKPKFKFIDLNNVPHKNFSFGKVKRDYGRASMEYLEKALELIKAREIDCLVTCPISKEAVNLAGFNWPGHTEYLARYSQSNDFIMMLLNKQLKITLVTRHIPLKSVWLQLNKDKIYKAISLTYKSLKEIFLIKNPRIVVCGLNPHASDNGLIGKEENGIIKPVLRNLRRKIRYLDGPLSADVAISKANRKEYDCVVAMYHDQALIPLKMDGDSPGVNITLGLDFIRTSPLHGTAFDIAKDHTLANPLSLIEAIKLAIRCTSNLRKD